MREQLEAVGLPGDSLDCYPRDFSGGQLQRITLARILLLQPALIIGDEPVSALDVSVQAQVVHLLERLRIESLLTYLLISHDLPLVSRIADRVAVMYLGEIVEAGAATDVVRQPLHPYTAALRSATPVARRSAIPTKRIVLKGDPASPLNPPSGCPFHTRCPIAREICKEDKPKLTVVRPGRRAACHFPGELDVNAGTSRTTIRIPAACASGTLSSVTNVPIRRSKSSAESRSTFRQARHWQSLASPEQGSHSPRAVCSDSFRHRCGYFPAR